MNYKRRLFKINVFIGFLIFGTAVSAQEVPAIKMSTTSTGTLTFSLKVDTIALKTDSFDVIIDWGNGVLDTVMGRKGEFTIEGLPMGNKKIEIFTKEIIYFNCGSSRITSVDVSKCTKLSYFDCGYNLLSVLNVSSNTQLATLICSSNSLSVLDLSKNLVLTSLWCDNNLFTSIDVTKNIALLNFYAYSNSLLVIDVSKNLELKNLDCGRNNLSVIDVSKNTKLENLFCYVNNISSLNVSKNLLLKSLWCNNNSISELNILANNWLEELVCDNNQLSNINLSGNANLSLVNLSNNLFTFETLPYLVIEGPYQYSPQAIIEIPSSVGDSLVYYGSLVDYSAMDSVVVDSIAVASKFAWKRSGDTALLVDTAYKVIAPGKFVFTKEFQNLTDSTVYCFITNPYFPELTLSTIRVKLKDRPTSINSALSVANCSVYPVPSASSIYVKGALGEQVNIYSVQGSLLKSLNNYNGASIDISGLKKGVYFIRTNNSQLKFVKN